MKLAAESRGQATVLTVLFLVVLSGMVALVLDVGSWYRSDRRLQQVADASALAGAQALPESTADAEALAVEYAGKNGDSLAGSEVKFSTNLTAHDTISVTLKRPAPGFFSKLFGLASVDVAAKASARAANAGEAKYVAPIAVNHLHKSLVGCKPAPCTDDTQIDLADLHKAGSGDAAGAFALINLRKEDDTGSVATGDLADWILHGFDERLPTGDYYSVPSTKFNSTQVVEALTIREGTVLLFPIYDRITGPGDNARYHVIGWAGFYVTSFKASGSGGTVYGHFTRRISEGLPASPKSGVPDYGVRVIQLVD